MAQQTLSISFGPLADKNYLDYFRRMELICSTAEVMDALGGTDAVAHLTDRKYSAAFNWRSFETFPPDTFVVMTSELAKLGLRAPESLWRMIPERASAQSERVT